MIARLAAAALAAAVLVAWRPALASCGSPAGCVCNAVGSTVYEVQSLDSGASDGGAIYAVVAAFGVIPDGGAPVQVTLPRGQASSGLIAVSSPGQAGRIVPLDSNGFTDCGPSFSKSAAAHAMLQNGEFACIEDLVPGADCDDAGCASASGIGLLGLAIGMSLIAVSRRRLR